jgi:hypothetical protein
MIVAHIKILTTVLATIIGWELGKKLTRWLRKKY